MGIFDQKQPPALPEPEQNQDAISEGMLEIKSENGQYTVLVRIAVTPEDEHIILNRYLNKILKHRKMSVAQEAKLLDTLWLEHLIVRWDLPIPLENKEKAVARLTQKDRDYLYQQIKAAQPERPLRERQIVQRSIPADVKRVIDQRQSRGKKQDKA